MTLSKGTHYRNILTRFPSEFLHVTDKGDNPGIGDGIKQRQVLFLFVSFDRFYFLLRTLSDLQKN